MISTTITIGNIIEILTIAIGGLIFLWEMRTRLALLQVNQDVFKDSVNQIKIELVELRKVTNMIAVQDQRLNGLEHQLTELRERFTSLTERIADFLESKTRKPRKRAASYDEDDGSLPSL